MVKVFFAETFQISFRSPASEKNILLWFGRRRWTEQIFSTKTDYHSCFLHLLQSVCVCDMMACYQRNVSVGNLRSESLPFRMLRRDLAKIGVYS